MTDTPTPAMPAGLFEESRRAVEAWGRARGAGGEGPAGADPPRAGQVRVLPELGEPRLTWAVLRVGAEETAPCLLVAADGNPLAGPDDVRVSEPGLGALTLRCRFAPWVNGNDLRGSTLAGVLPPEAVARAEARLQDLEAGRPAGTFSEEEAAEDPAYEDWIEEVVRPAAARLAARAGAAVPAPLPFPARSASELRPGAPAAWLRRAAVLAFLALGAGGGFLTWRQGREIAGLRAAAQASAAAQRQAVAALTARRAELEAKYREDLRRAGEDRAQLEAEHRAQLAEISAELAKLRRATAVRNPVIAILEPAAVRRGPLRVEVGAEASHLVLVFSVADRAGTEFQVEVDAEPSSKRVFLQSGLRADSLGEVHLGLPAALVPPGDYRVRLWRQTGPRLKLVREHAIEVSPRGAT